MARDLYKYNTLDNIFESLDFKSTKIYVPKKFRQIGEHQFYLDQQDYWVSDSSGKWERILESRHHFMTFDGNIYYSDLDDKKVYYKTPTELKTLATDGVFVTLLREFDNYEVLQIDGSSSNNISLCKNGEIFWSISIEDFPYNKFNIDNKGNYVYTSRNENKQYVLNISNIYGNDTSRVTLGDFIKPHHLSYLSISRDKISFKSSWGQVYTSTNLAQTIDSTLETDIIDPYSSVQVINDKFYLATNIGMLVSDNGLLWEQLIDFGEGYAVSDFEYSPENKLYIYSDKGVIITDIEVSIEEHELNYISDFKIYPNPASNYITLEAVADLDIGKVLDINGKSHNVYIEDSVVDISNLAIGLYFIEIKVKGKTFYQMFKVER